MLPLIFFIFGGKLIFSSAVHPLKTYPSILDTVSGISILFKEEQQLKALFPIDIKLFGNDMLSSSEQFSKVYDFISVIPFGTTKFF